MQTVFSASLLARLQASRPLDATASVTEDRGVDSHNVSLPSRHDTLPAEDPDDSVDPDDRALPALPPPSPDWLRSLPPKVARFFLHEPPSPPRWQTSAPPDGMDDGAWCG